MPKLHTSHFRAMGTQVEIGLVVEAECIQPGSLESECIESEPVLPEPTQFQRTLDGVEAQIRLHESRLSRFQQSSDVSRVNANGGNWTSVHPDTAEVATFAIEAFENTRGLFNPCLGQWLERWGYKVSFEQLATESGSKEPLWIPVNAPRCPLEVREQQSLVKVHHGWQLDLGGIAKGWIVEQAAAFIRNQGYQQFIVNAGGDMVCAGRNQAIPWKIGIDDPENPKQSILTLDVDNLAVATSGTYRRHWQQGSAHLHHLVDPRTGQPANNGITSCTVVHPSLIAAEVLAKTALILGIKEGAQFLHQQAPHGWVIVDEHGKVVHAWNS